MKKNRIKRIIDSQRKYLINKTHFMNLKKKILLNQSSQQIRLKKKIQIRIEQFESIYR